jgi:hypothetical protein
MGARLGQGVQEPRGAVGVELVARELERACRQHVPVAVAGHQRQVAITRRAARDGHGQRQTVDSRDAQEAAPARVVGGQRVDHEVAPARVDPADAGVRHTQEVVGEAVDQLVRRARQPARVEAPQRPRQVALGHPCRRRVEQRHQQVAVLVLESVE